MKTVERVMIEPGVVQGEWWHRLEDGRIQCDLCPRFCKLHEGQRGFCFVRQARDGAMVLTSYGRASGFCVDPIEKKPLNHFYPGSEILSFGTAGCNLGCRFCQNWDISKARQVDTLSAWASPQAVAETAACSDCRSIAFTYNDPVIFAEYALDCAIAAHEHGLKTVAVSAGYITPAARPAFFAHIDAANIDLKAFTEDFYHRLCFGALAPVLDTLRWLKHESEVWFEITTLLIPGHNDSPDEIARMCAWLVENVGPDVPLHFSAFHPDYKMMNVPHTPPATLTRARQQALEAGLNYVYTGNVYDQAGQSTYCASCGHLLIERNWYRLGRWHLDRHGCCQFCGAKLAGHFAPQPEHWSGQRRRVTIEAT